MYNVKIGDKVTLTPAEIEEANTLGLQRHGNNRANGVRSDFAGRSGKHDPNNLEKKLERDKQGVRGEFAFAKMFGLGEETWTIVKRIAVQSAKNGTDPADAIVYSESGRAVQVDVKATSASPGNLLVTREKLGNKDFCYALMIEEAEGTFRFAGMITTGRVARLHKEGAIREESRSTIWCPSHWLNPADEVINYAASVQGN